MVEDATHRLLSRRPLRLLMLLGTRPEAVKLAPLVVYGRTRPDLDIRLVSSGQHPTEMLEALGHFGLRADRSVTLFPGDWTLADMAAGVLTGLARELASTQPDVVVVQGDTTTAFAGALAAFYAGIPVAHVEAGLRTNDSAEPFPEEMNRRLIDNVATFRFPPTPAAAANLAAEGLGGSDVFTTGNTIVDALHTLLARERAPLDGRASRFLDPHWNGRIVLTAHRRENWGKPMDEIALALQGIGERFPTHVALLPLHPNPLVRRAFRARALPENVIVADPLPYVQFITALERSDLVVTDSGGVLEEATALGRPALILRNRTERPEAVAVGSAKVIGIEHHGIEAAVAHSLQNGGLSDQATDVFGDGHASERILDWLRWRFGLTVVRPEPFVPTSQALLETVLPLRRIA